MTYSHSTPDAMTASPAGDILGIEAAGAPGLFQALIGAALMLLAKFAKARGPKTRTALMLTLGLLLLLHGGTRDEKRAFIKDLFAKSEERLDALYARYLIWRQRKCWAWGGGLRAPAPGAALSTLASSNDALSYDALIPD